jgi:oxaloacetate decarboxylase beta subunit
VLDKLEQFFSSTGFSGLYWGNLVMLIVAGILIYLAIRKKYEPLLLIPIGFGVLLSNLPGTGLSENGGLLYYIGQGVHLAIFPPLIFLGIGAMTDFSPLIANPKTFLMGAGAQLGIFCALFRALAWGFPMNEAGSIGIIGGADGPTAIYTTIMLVPEKPEFVGIIAIAAYSYMALVPIIQPPIMRALTTKRERVIEMEDLRDVSRLELILFPIIVTVLVILLLPQVAPLIGMLMFGNILRECGVTERLSNTAANELINIVTIFLALIVGSEMAAERVLIPDTLKILFLGFLSFCFGTAGGVLMGKFLCWITKGKVNPLIGAAGVSAVPMSARVVQVEGQKANHQNFLLMHAMGPNVAGVIGSAIVAGLLLAFLK